MIGSKVYLTLFLALSCLDLALGMFSFLECQTWTSLTSFFRAWHHTALKCHCDICTAETNYTCETDGFCFTSTSLNRKTGALVHAYRYTVTPIIWRVPFTFSPCQCCCELVSCHHSFVWLVGFLHVVTVAQHTIKIHCCHSHSFFWVQGRIGKKT